MIGSQWSKSSYSSSNANCVEVRGQGERVGIRDSKNPDGPVLSFGTEEWDAFIEGIKNGELGL
jgi:hypothetical protein